MKKIQGFQMPVLFRLQQKLLFRYGHIFIAKEISKRDFQLILYSWAGIYRIKLTRILHTGVRERQMNAMYTSTYIDIYIFIFAYKRTCIVSK